MKILKNKFFIKLIISICLCLTILNFVGMNEVYATGTSTSEKLWGGTLLTPVIDLLTAIGDFIMEILHNSIQSQEAAIIEIQTAKLWQKIVVGILIIAAVALTVVLATLFTGGVAALGAMASGLAGGALKATVVLAVAGSAGSIIGAGIAKGTIVGIALKEKMIPDNLYLPAFSISAEEIFKNDIILFDVNFFNPKPSQEVTVATNRGHDVEEILYANLTIYMNESTTIYETEQIYDNAEKYSSLIKEALHENLRDETNLYISDIRTSINKTAASGSNPVVMAAFDNIINTTNATLTEMGLTNIVDASPVTITTNITDSNYNDSATLEVLSRDTVANEDKNIKIVIEIVTDAVAEEATTETITINSTAKQLQEIVSTWYFIIRNVSLLVLMLILIYIGIRIVIGSTAGEKAKYKERLMDWFVAVCLIMVMHYIMVFAVEIVDKITDLVGTINNENLAYIELTYDQSVSAKEVLSSYNTIGSAMNEAGEVGKGAIAYFDENGVSIGAGNGVLIWPTDLAGAFRIQSQVTEDGTKLWAGYSLCYIVLVLYTLFFAYTYLRRVVYMAFLTMIAPLVALTYPIDKITDGKAQAFNSWLREYIFNLMIQPMHLLLYTILVSSAFTLASQNALYALVAIGFMMPAEKLMRKFFGFEKAQTPGLLGGAAGAAFAMTGLQSIMKWHGKGRDASASEKEKDDDVNIKYSSSEGVDTFGVLSGTTPAKETTTDSERAEGAEGAQIKVAGGAANGGVADGANGGVVKGAKGANGEADDGEAGETVTRTKGETTDFYPQPQASKEAIEAEIAKARERRNNAMKYDSPTARAVNRKNEAQRHSMVRGLMKGYNKALGKKVLKRIQKGQPIKALLRASGGLAGGALFGAAGLALGIASGDMGNAFKYTTAGMTGGYALGGGITGSAMNIASVDTGTMKKEAEIYAYGADYGEIKYREALEEDLKSESNVNYLRTTFGWSETQAKTFLDTTGRRCYESGVQDVEEMATIGQVLSNTDEEKTIPTLDEAIAATNLKRRLPSKIKNMSDKKLNEYRETYAKTFAEKLGLHDGLSEDEQKKIMDEARAKADQTIKYMKNLESANSSLTEI